MKLQTRIFIIFLTLAVLPLITLTYFSYTRYTTVTYDRIDDISFNIMNSAVYEMENILSDIEDSIGVFTFYSDSNFSIINNLKQFSNPDTDYNSYDLWKANNDISFISRNILYSNTYINGLYVFTPSSAILSHTTGKNGDLLVDFYPSTEDWYLETLALEGSTYISGIKDHSMFSGSAESLFFSKALYDVYSHEFLGVLVVDCSSTLFNLDQINSMPDITLLEVTNTNNNTILYTSNYNFNDQNTNNKIITYTKSLSIEPLELKATFDFDALYKEFNLTASLLIIVALVCISVLIFLTYFLSKHITYPLEYLSKKMSNQKVGYLAITSKYMGRSDEVGILYNEYNNMIETLNLSIKKEYQDKLITLDAQMLSLEAQINSHFLFNTLESINALATINDDERISKMVISLGNMFRYSIKTKSELVPLEDELHHVLWYDSIQQIRFLNKYDLILEIDPEFYSLKVLKLILQPLVENALLHGLQNCTTGNKIYISATIDLSNIYISVKDNGLGMENDDLLALNEKLNKKSSFTELGHRSKQSIGLKNIHSRIELYYGIGYGITIQSIKNKGTSICIKLPLLPQLGD